MTPSIALTNSSQTIVSPNVIDESPIRDALSDRLFRDCDIEITLHGASWRGTSEEIHGGNA